MRRWYNVRCTGAVLVQAGVPRYRHSDQVQLTDPYMHMHMVLMLL